MKKWVEKLVEQFDFDWSGIGSSAADHAGTISEDRATLLYVLDTYNKNLIEIDGHPIRKVRETLDEFSKEIVRPHGGSLEKILFRFRQFFSAYRMDECTYVQKTFEEFRTIIWDFVDQLAADMSEEQREDSDIMQSLEKLKEAVESNSIDVLKSHSRLFIDSYVEKQFKKHKRNSSRMKNIRKNLNVVKQQLTVANDAMRTDHLTGAFNRRSFDECCERNRKLFEIDKTPVSMILADIDYFKRINDTYGHELGDFVLKELVNTLQTLFNRECDVVARIGGEEFAIVLHGLTKEEAAKRAEELLTTVRKETYVYQTYKIRCTVSLGIAELVAGEDVAAWVKRADLALYDSKNHGRDRFTVAPSPHLRVA